jgi:flagellar hook-basal body complex protein FliE
MSSIPIPVIPPAGLSAADAFAAPQLSAAPAAGPAAFSRLLSNGLEGVSNDVLNADRLVRDFALSDSMPVHQVTYALEQARLSLNLMMQVRNRLVEAYQQMMNMQL